jgi:hypothetical protein
MILPFVIFTGCGHTPQFNTITINDSIKVSTNTLIYEKSLQDPWCIGLIDTILILGNFEGEPLLELFSTTGRPLAKCLQQGRGPNEVLSVGTIQVDVATKTFFVYDLGGRKILQYDLNALLTDKKYQPELLFNLANKNYLSGLDKIYVGKDFFVAENRSPQGRIAYMKRDMTDVKYYACIPTKVHEHFNDVGNALMFSSYITMSPNQKYLAAVGVTAGMIDLYKIKKNGLDSIWACYEYFPNNVIVQTFGDITQGFFTRESLTGYSCVGSSDNYVYALFTKNKFENPLSNYGKTIRRVTWKDQSVTLIKTDREIKSFCVSEDDQTIYAVGMDIDGQPEILKIDLK